MGVVWQQWQAEGKGGDWDSQSFCQMSDGVKAARDVVINHGRAASEYAQQKTWGREEVKGG